MKTIQQTLSLCVCLLLTISCLANPKKENTVQEKITVATFDKISISCVVDLYLKQSSTQSVEVEAEEEVMKYLDIKVVAGRLMVAMDQLPRKYNNGDKQRISLYVSTPNIKDIDVTGVCTIFTEKDFKTKGKLSLDLSGVVSFDDIDLSADELKIDANGVVNGNLNVQASKLEVNFNGVGDLDVSGNVKKFTASANGVGKINAKKLKYEEKDIESSWLSKISL